MSLTAEWNGRVQELEEFCFWVRLESLENSGAAMLSFQCPVPLPGGAEIPNGATVRFVRDGVCIFLGYVVGVKASRETVRWDCMDQLVYWKAKASAVRKEKPLDQWIREAAALVPGGGRIRLGKLTGTGVNLSKKVFDSRSVLDMVYDGMEETNLLTGKEYLLRDNGGAVELVEKQEAVLPLVLGDGSLADGYQWERRLDEQSYNLIRLVRDDKGNGSRVLAQAENRKSMENWGCLVLQEKAPAHLNQAQVIARAQSMLKLYCRESQNLVIEGMGSPLIYGGSSLKVEISREKLSSWAVVEKAVHTFSGSEHRMAVKLRLWE